MACSSARGGRGTGQGSGQDSGTVGRIHSDAYETLSQHESSDDEEPTVGRRGPVAPTPLPEPRNREQICVIYGQFSNQGKATRTMGETLEAMWSHPWKSWKDVSKEDEDRMFERFKVCIYKKKCHNSINIEKTIQPEIFGTGLGSSNRVWDRIWD
ncbi:hypothetical protein Hanom_Chr12g01117051 [Helianthus anomalus]